MRAAEVAAEQLVVVNGVAQGMYLAVGALARPGPVQLAVEDLHSARTYELLEAAGVRVPVPVDDEGIDVSGSVAAPPVPSSSPPPTSTRPGSSCRRGGGPS